MKYVKLDDSIKNEWKEQMLRYNTTMERWSILQQKRKEAHSKKYRDRLFIERIKIAVTYPRIDIKVTEGFNHLLKAPFSVHPKTGKGEFSLRWPRQPVYKKTGSETGFLAQNLDRLLDRDFQGRISDRNAELVFKRQDSS